MSEWLMLTLAMSAAIAVVVLITVLRHRRPDEEFDPDETPDVIEYMTMMIGVVYAIVLGLAIAGVWEAKSGAEDSVRREAFALHEADERLAGYPAPVRGEIRADIAAYVRYAVHEEWPAMQGGEGLSERGDELLDEVRRALFAYAPKTDAENRAAYTLGDQIAAAEEARNERALNSGPTMPSLVWFGLISGGLVAMGMVFALQIQRSARELILAGLHSGLLAFLLFLVWEFDQPYVRDSSGMLEPFTTLFPKAAG
ncbi:DUF4239 domain-containing protein [Streptomyces sp. WMMC500]|uniref:bestrophin-like domain n=1 Tax=Streptomyces sp. WMMC500 TaxID=3015154 RepID=UPI00248B0823|nr:DUF4239 domain-containing protein [Streptomyces sp. WMMC500]WBB61459.1 DUF4239 domain-containing protein [Streptomyces sp. WMMC500]